MAADSNRTAFGWSMILAAAALHRSRRVDGGWTIAATAVMLLLALPGPVLAADVIQPDDWPMAARDHANTRYAPQTDITPANVGTLKLAFTFSTGTVRGNEAAPIVVGGTMFVVTPY